MMYLIIIDIPEDSVETAEDDYDYDDLNARLDAELEDDETPPEESVPPIEDSYDDEQEANPKQNIDDLLATLDAELEDDENPPEDDEEESKEKIRQEYKKQTGIDFDKGEIRELEALINFSFQLNESIERFKGYIPSFYWRKLIITLKLLLVEEKRSLIAHLKKLKIQKNFIHSIKNVF